MTIQGAQGRGVEPAFTERPESPLARPFRHFLKDGTGVPGATDILAEMIPSWMPESRYLQRGRVIHAALALALRGHLEWGSLHPDLHGWVKSGLLWAERHKIDVIEVERAFVSESFHFGATLDLLAHDFIIDWKTNKAPKTGNLQTAAQVIASDSPADTPRACVELQKDGSEAITINYDDPEDLSNFLNLCAAWHIRRSYGIPSNAARS